MVEVVRYEAKWFADSEWEECSQKDYHDIVTSVRDGSTYPDGTGPKARALGVITDEGGLLLIGPPGYDSWRDAAIKEKMQRVELERELKALKAKNEQLENASLLDPSNAALQAYVKEHFVRKHFCVPCNGYTIVDGICERNANHTDRQNA